MKTTFTVSNGNEIVSIMSGTAVGKKLSEDDVSEEEVLCSNVEIDAAIDSVTVDQEEAILSVAEVQSAVESVPEEEDVSDTELENVRKSIVPDAEVQSAVASVSGEDNVSEKELDNVRKFIIPESEVQAAVEFVSVSGSEDIPSELGLLEKKMPDAPPEPPVAPNPNSTPTTSTEEGQDAENNGKEIGAEKELTENALGSTKDDENPPEQKQKKRKVR